jgi:hypothetical protein
MKLTTSSSTGHLAMFQTVIAIHFTTGRSRGRHAPPLEIRRVCTDSRLLHPPTQARTGEQHRRAKRRDQRHGETREGERAAGLPGRRCLLLGADGDRGALLGAEHPAALGGATVRRRRRGLAPAGLPAARIGQATGLVLALDATARLGVGLDLALDPGAGLDVGLDVALTLVVALAVATPAWVDSRRLPR